MTVNVQTWTPEQVWAAAACAHRINDGYFKHDERNQQGKVVKIRNFTLVQSALEDVSQIPSKDFDLGRSAFEHISQRLILKALKGRLKEFDEVLSRIVSKTDFHPYDDRYEIAVVTSQIRSVAESKKDLEWQEKIDRSAGHLGPIGDKIEVGVEIFKAVWSEKWNIHFYQGITPTCQGVWFTHREELLEGEKVKISGTVVKYRDFSTQLNRVKLRERELV